MRTIKQVIEDDNIKVETKPLSEDGGKLYVMLSMMQNTEGAMSDIGLELFPNGFYTHDTCMLLVDNYVKTGKTINGFIY